jgi:hypothetical protein
MDDVHHIAQIAAQLMGGSHPEFIHEVHVPKFVKMAITIINESRNQFDAIDPEADSQDPRLG